jgi:hypothetical protein
MSGQVYYQDGKITITDKVIVTENKTYDLSAVSGLSIKYIPLYLVAAFLTVFFIVMAILDGDPIFRAIIAVFLIIVIFHPRKHRLVATFSNGNTVFLFRDINGGKAREIMHAFTLAKNS